LKKPEKSLIICICGLAGSGKSTVGKLLARNYGLKYYSGGDALKALAVEAGYQPKNEGWWETSEGLKFLKQRAIDPHFDRRVDKKLLEFAKMGNVVLDSWTMPWLLKDGFKIWLEASLETRAQRVAGRDKIPLKEALAALKKKEEQTRQIYRKLYGFSLGEDFSPFHLIVDTENLTIQEVYQTIAKVIDNYLLKQDL
jgi:cytidylate kinase